MPRRISALLLLTLCLPFLAAAAGPLDDLDRGHRLLIQHGLQLQALVLDNQRFDADVWAESNFTTVNFWAIPNVPLLGPAPGTIPWSRWFGGHLATLADAPLPPEEAPYEASLVSMQPGDEQDFTKPEELAPTVEVLNYWREHYPGKIHMLSHMLKNMDELAPYMDQLMPDLVAGGSYRLTKPEEVFVPIRRGGSPQLAYKEMAAVRALCLQGHAGSGGHPIPYGIFTQTFHWPTDPNAAGSGYNIIVSEAQMRLQQTAAWAFGCKWICAFIYNNSPDGIVQHNGLTPVFFSEGNDWTEKTDRFHEYAQLNAESLRLAPALLRLVSTRISIVSGIYNNPNCLLPGGGLGPCTEAIPLPTGIGAWQRGAGDPYIASITQTNLGGANDGLPGDVLVGHFKPLHEDFDGPLFTDEPYFMLVNSMAFQDKTGAQARQRVAVDFDFTGTQIRELQRLSRETGLVESVPLERLGGSHYRLTLDLDGGEGDLFKFKTGAPFVLNDTPDTDGDGHVDAEDAFPGDRLEWEDLDGDGLGDSFERRIVDQLAPLYGGIEDVLPEDDPDGDGLSNLEEFLGGYDPLDPESRNRLPLGPASAALAFAAVLAAGSRRLRRGKRG